MARTIDGTAFLTVELEQKFSNGYGYWTTAEFEIEFTATRYIPPSRGEYYGTDGKVQDWKLTLVTFDRDEFDNPASFHDLTEYQKACLVEWAQHNRADEIQSKMEDAI